MNLIPISNVFLSFFSVVELAIRARKWPGDASKSPLDRLLLLPHSWITEIRIRLRGNGREEHGSSLYVVIRIQKRRLCECCMYSIFFFVDPVD